MRKETYEAAGAPGGAELCCDKCAQPMRSDEDLHTCLNCGNLLEMEFQYCSPPEEGVNFGFARPNKWEIEEAKNMLGEGKAWCIVEGSDAQFRLYKLY